jgi:hypothetical protein
MQILRAIIVVATLSAIAAVAAAGEERDRLRFPGFSLVPPEGNRWTATTETPHSGIQVFFSRDINKERKALGLEKHHSFVAMATADLIRELPYDNGDELLQRFTDDIKNAQPPNKLKSISVAVSPQAADYAKTPFCVDYNVIFEDEDRISGKKGKVFLLNWRGKRCLHLTYPELIIEISYSQRSYQGKWVTAFDKEVERFFSGLEFTPVGELLPYVAEQLEAYSQTLLKQKNQAEAESIKKHAARLREGPGHFGFDPAADLETYASFLREHGDERGAQRMTILATKWFYNNAMAAGFSYEKLLKSQ